MLVAISAITLGCGEKSTPTAGSGSSEAQALTKVAAPAPPTLADARPALPEPHVTADAAFAAQTRDPEWAPTTETEIKRRFKKVRGGRLEDAECRQSQCRLVITGSEGDVGKTIADLESDRGLHGFATTILLTAPETQPDGTLVLRAFATFER